MKRGAQGGEQKGETMSEGPFKAFEGEQYLSLETYRKSGEAIATPVWFAEDAGVIYVYSLANMGKVKRIRNNPKVRIAPCRLRGELKGDWVPATARVLPDGDHERVHALLNRKYGLMKRIGSWFSRLRGKQHDMIAISPQT